MYTEKLECTRCRASFGVQERIWACKDCGSLLDVKYNYEEVQKSFKKDDLLRRIPLSLEIQGTTAHKTKLCENKEFDHDETVVMSITGFGSKDVETAKKQVGL